MNGFLISIDSLLHPTSTIFHLFWGIKNDCAFWTVQSLDQTKELASKPSFHWANGFNGCHTYIVNNQFNVGYSIILLHSNIFLS